MISSAVIADALAAVKPVSPVVKRPVGLPVPLPFMNASSSAAAIRRTNSDAIYVSRLKAESLSSSSDTFMIVASLCAPSVTTPNASSLSVYSASSSVHAAAPCDATTGIFLSPLSVVIIVP